MTERRTIKMTGRVTALVVAFMMLAVPAMAAVITQNFLRADVSTDAACFIKTPGADAQTFSNPANNPYIAFDATATETDPVSGIDLLQERLTVEGYAGDRITYTDYVHYENNCGTDISLRLVAESDFAGNPAKDGTWADVQATIYLSVATGGANPDLSSADWDSSPIVVSATAVPGSTGAVIVPAGSFVQGAIVIDTDAAAAPGGPHILRYTAEATHL